jgi:hypothetical protein
VFSQGVGSLVADRESDPDPDDPDPDPTPVTRGTPGDPGDPTTRASEPGEARTRPRLRQSPSPTTTPTRTWSRTTSHYRNILCMTDYGIARGFPDGTYRPLEERHARPDGDVHREHDRAGARAPEARPRFDDVGPESPHWEAIHKLAEAGVVEGRTETTYAPRAG